MKANGAECYIDRLRELTPKLSNIPQSNLNMLVKNISNSLKDSSKSSEEKLEKIKDIISLYEDY